MVEPATGDGPWATVAWCTLLTVHLHRSLEAAALALGIINRSGCGHQCWGDHELVNLSEPEAIDPDAEYLRGPQRAAHARTGGCVCIWWANGKAAGAAMRRAQTRRQRAVA